LTKIGEAVAAKQNVGAYDEVESTGTAVFDIQAPHNSK